MAVFKEKSKYEVISELLIDTLDYLGTCSAKDSANIWANGVKLRNGAMQVSSMTKSLRMVYIEKLNKNFSNWVTGVSSPWVENYDIIECNKINAIYVIRLKFYMATSEGLYHSFCAVLKLKQENRILEDI